MPGQRRRSGSNEGPSGDAAADELYGLPQDQFVAARNDLVKRAKAAKDPDTANRIGRLAKPNAVAWLANQLVRAHREDLDELLELGATLRAATAALDAARLRELTAKQRRKTADLVHRAKQLGASAGQPVSEATARGLEDTLHAALADADAAQELRAGRLTAGLESSGFPGMALTAAPPAKPTKQTKATKAREAPKAKGTMTTAVTDTRGTSAAAQRAEDELASAQDDHRQATAARDEAQQAVENAQAQADAAAQQVDRLTAELDEARQAQRAADKTSRQAVRTLADAERAVRQVSARLDRASAHRAEFDRANKQR